jgi:hypothetical protein
MIEDIFTTINALVTKGREAKDIARKDDEHLEQFEKASEFYELAASMIDDVLKTVEPEKVNMITRSKALRDYYLYESNECLSAYDYKRELFDGALDYSNKALLHIESAINIIEKNIDSLNEETRDFLLPMKMNWTHSLNTIRVKQKEPIAKKAMRENNFIDALDAYREMDRLNDLAFNYVVNSEMDEVYKRISRGNYLALKANINLSIAGVYLLQLDKHDYQKEILEQYLTAIDLIEKALKENPEQLKYKEGKETLKGYISNLLNENAENWKEFYYAFENNKQLINIMKETDINKFNELELSRKLDSTENKVKKLLILGGFWVTIFLIILASVVTLFILNLPVWVIPIIVILVQFIYAMLSATIMRSMGDLSESGLLEIYKMTIKYNFKLLDKTKPKIND